MAKNVADSTSADTSAAAKSDGELTEDFMVLDAEPTEFDGEEEVAPPPRANHKDPSIRRKIEDLLERRRLREELGIYDDEAWEGL